MVTSFRGWIPALNEMRKSVYKTIFIEGSIVRWIGCKLLSYSKRVGLWPLVELYRIRKCTKGAVRRKVREALRICTSRLTCSAPLPEGAAKMDKLHQGQVHHSSQTQLYELVTRRNRGEQQTHQPLFPISIVVFLRQIQDRLLTLLSPCIMALERCLSAL